MTDDISKVVPPVHAVTFVPSFSEAARRLGMAQAQGNRPAIAHWQGIVDAHEAAAKAALRLESATTPAEVGTECAEFVNMVGDEFGNDAGVRLRDLFATLARQLAEAEAGLRAILDARRYRTDGGLADLVNRCRSMSQEDEAVIAAGAANVAEYKSLAEATRRLGEVEAYRDATFDGNAVYAALDDRAKLRTSAENVADVLDALNRVARLASHSEGGSDE